MNPRYLTRQQYVAWRLARTGARALFFGALAYLFFAALLGALP